MESMNDLRIIKINIETMKLFNKNYGKNLTWKTEAQRLIDYCLGIKRLNTKLN